MPTQIKCDNCENKRDAFDNAEYYACGDDEEINAPNSPEECICEYIDLFGDRPIADVVKEVCPITVIALADDEDAAEDDYAQFGIKEGMTILKEVGSREYSETEVLAILKDEWWEDAY